MAPTLTPPTHTGRILFGLLGGPESQRLATHNSAQESPTAGSLRQSLISELCLTPLSQNVTSARTWSDIGTVWHMNTTLHQQENGLQQA